MNTATTYAPMRSKASFIGTFMATPRASGDTQAQYAERLWTFLNEHGWEYHPNQSRRCIHLLDNPRHRRLRRSCHIAAGLDDRFYPGDPIEPGEDPRGRRYNFDHVVLLRRGPSNAPTQWALLSQPYGPQNPGGRAKMLGPAPYGNGTHALLYEGVSL